MKWSGNIVLVLFSCVEILSIRVIFNVFCFFFVFICGVRWCSLKII